MGYKIKRQSLLKTFVIASIILTAFHFTDNYINFDMYPQPDWITPSSVYISWVIWTVAGMAGYWLYKNQRFWLSYIFLVFYSLCGLVSLGHYNHGAMSDFSLKMHFFIIADGLAGLGVLGFTLWSGLIFREQFNDSKA